MILGNMRALGVRNPTPLVIAAAPVLGAQTAQAELIYFKCFGRYDLYNPKTDTSKSVGTEIGFLLILDTNKKTLQMQVRRNNSFRS
jgi:hypothetical protein